MIGAVVFDFDGVVIDTERPEFDAWAEVFRRHGCHLDVADWADAIGSRGRFHPYSTLVARATRPVGDEAQVRRVKRLLARTAEPAEPLPGVLSWIRECRSSGIPIAIASSSTPAVIAGHLKRLGLDVEFPCVACCDGTLRPKPEPDTYLAACERLGVEPSLALAVEDSFHGVTAAVAAGLRCVAVPHALTREMDFSAADLVLESLACYTVVEVAEQLFRPG